MVPLTDTRSPESGPRHGFAALVALLPCALAPCAMGVLGYGAYLRSLSLVFFPLLVTFSWITFSFLRSRGRLMGRRKLGSRPEVPMIRVAQPWGILSAFLLSAGLSWFAGIQIRDWRCESICRKAQPLIDLLEKHRTEHGSYPATLQDLLGFGAWEERSGFSVRQGRYLRSELDVAGMEGADLTLYLTPLDYLCIVPLEQKLPMSITRFHILRRDSESPRWTRDFMIWSFSSRRDDAF